MCKIFENVFHPLFSTPDIVHCKKEQVVSNKKSQAAAAPNTVKGVLPHQIIISGTRFVLHLGR